MKHNTVLKLFDVRDQLNKLADSSNDICLQAILHDIASNINEVIYSNEQEVRELEKERQQSLSYIFKSLIKRIMGVFPSI